ncbi:MAG TPA: T9SS type A sorting domain-containing protein [Bacteroidetes bacterium]|nr:T9SS type A sorting domain-containing protein [Bacteroidota bacterium]
MKQFALLFLFFSFGSFSVNAQNYRTLGSTPADTLDVLHYQIEFSIPDIASQDITAKTTIELTTKVNNLLQIRLDLLALQVDSIYVESVKNTAFSYDDSTIVVPLSSSLNIGDTINIAVYYQGSPVIDPSGWGGFYFSGVNYAFNLGVGFQDIPHNYGRVWFPCADNFTDRAFYDYYINCDTSKMAVCGGLLQSITPNGDSTHTVHWKMHQDIPTYLASMAVGDYVLYTDSIQLMQGKTPIDIWVAPNLLANVPSSFPNLDTVLHIFEDRFGPYRWDKVGYVGVPFNSGAMEHATNIAYPNVCVNGTNAYEALYAHELSHHWFGDLVTCSTAEDMWINEGWASYTEAIVSEDLYGLNVYKKDIRAMHAKAVRYAHIEDAGFFALNNVPLFNTYGTTAYDKGASMVHTMRHYMGDSLFFPAVKDFLNHFAYSDISSAMLRDRMSLHSGINMSDFFDNWIFTPGYPHFDIDSISVTASALPEYNVRVYMQQKGRGRSTYGNNNIVEIHFMDEHWNYYSDTMQFSGQFGYKDFTVAFAPTTAFCDLEEKMADARVSEYKIIKSTGTKVFDQTYCTASINSVSDSALLRITHHWVAPEKANIPSSSIYRIHNGRYWTVEGIQTDNMDYNLRFSYNRTTSSNGYLDDEFLTTTSSADSLVLLWRKDNASDWEIVNFVALGSSSAGNLHTYHAQLGQYALGIAEPNQSGENERNESDKLKLFPNPAKNEICIQVNPSETANLKIIDINGKEVFSKKMEAAPSTIYWQTSSFAAGIYEVLLLEKSTKTNQKLILY